MRPLRRFLFRLAILLGKTVGELERTLTVTELTEWLAYHRIEPLPDAHWDAAQVCSVVANANSKKTWEVDDFLPRAITPRRLSPEQSGNLLRRMVAAKTEDAHGQA